MIDEGCCTWACGAAAGRLALSTSKRLESKPLPKMGLVRLLTGTLSCPQPRKWMELVSVPPTVPPGPFLLTGTQELFGKWMGPQISRAVSCATCPAGPSILPWPGPAFYEIVLPFPPLHPQPIRHPWCSAFQELSVLRVTEQVICT